MSKPKTLLARGTVPVEIEIRRSESRDAAKQFHWLHNIAPDSVAWPGHERAVLGIDAANEIVMEGDEYGTGHDGEMLLTRAVSDDEWIAGAES